MAIKYINSRQYVKAAVAVVDADLSTGSKILLEPGAMLLGGRGTIVSAATGTTPTLTLTAHTASGPVLVINAQAISAPATFDISTGAGSYFAAGVEMEFSVGGTDPAGGKIIVELEYVLEDGQNELYGRSA